MFLSGDWLMTVTSLESNLIYLFIYYSFSLNAMQIFLYFFQLNEGTYFKGKIFNRTGVTVIYKKIIYIHDNLLVNNLTRILRQKKYLYIILGGGSLHTMQMHLTTGLQNRFTDASNYKNNLIQLIPVSFLEFSELQNLHFFD